MVTASEIADALAGRRGPVVVRFLYEQRDHDFALVASLTGAVERCSIELDVDRRAVRTANFVIDPTAMPVDFDPAEDHIAVTARVLVEGAFEDFAMGLFHLDVPVVENRPNANALWRVQGTDLTVHLLSETVSTPLTVASGTNYITAIETRLDALSLNHAIPATPEVTPVDRTWAPGTTIAKIVDDLAFGINYYPVWPGASGIFTSRERIDPSTEASAVVYATTFEPKMIDGEQPFVTKEDRSRFANRIATLIDHPKRTPEFALRVNDDPTSPISTVATGQTITEELAGGYVVDVAKAGDISTFELRDRAARSLLGTLTTLLDPRRDAHEFYTLRIETIEVATLWRANGWTVDLSTEGQMRHELGRAQSVQISTP